jgi:hypothetical protein
MPQWRHTVGRSERTSGRTRNSVSVGSYSTCSKPLMFVLRRIDAGLDVIDFEIGIKELRVGLDPWRELKP